MRARKSTSTNHIVTQIEVKLSKRDLIKVFCVIVLAQAVVSRPSRAFTRGLITGNHEGHRP